MDLMPMGKLAMSYWAREARLDKEPDDSQQEESERRKGRLARWANTVLCLASRGAVGLGAWLERQGKPCEPVRADRVGWSG
jgi:hypothetical protein